MRYKLSNPDIQEALSSINQFTYALLYNYSSINLCETKTLRKEDWEDCYEARLFRKDAELHLLFGEEYWTVLVEDIPDEETAEGSSIYEADETLTISYRLADKMNINLTEKKQTVEVQKYLKSDEDGQMTIVLTRLQDMR